MPILQSSQVMSTSWGASQMLAHIQSAWWWVKHVDLSHLRIPITWPENSGNGSPEPWKFGSALFFIGAPRAQSIHQNLLIISSSSWDRQFCTMGMLVMVRDRVYWFFGDEQWHGMIVDIAKLPTRYVACCAAMLSSDISLAAIVETTAVQSVQVSAAARTRRAEVKRKTFVRIFCHYFIKGRIHTFIVWGSSHWQRVQANTVMHVWSEGKVLSQNPRFESGFCI